MVPAKDLRAHTSSSDERASRDLRDALRRARDLRSSAVLEQVKQKLQLDTEDLGERALKNIDEPVHAYRIAHGGSLKGPGEPTDPAADSADVGLALPERPSVTIMPFRNLNGDAESDFVAGGIGLGPRKSTVR